MDELIRERSKAIFAAPYRLEILAAIAGLPGDQPFRTGTVQDRIGASLAEGSERPDKTTINRTLTTLRDAELLTRVGGGGTYRRLESAFWTFVVDYHSEVERRYAPTTLDVAG